MLKKQKGNMYEFVTHMWSPIRGKCSHDCSYCYMKRWGEQPSLHIDEKDLATDLGKGNFIFVGHTIDLFADDVSANWIRKVLGRTRVYLKNKYLFQTKNPARYFDFGGEFPDDTVFGTTIETNRDIVVSKAPSVANRAYHLGELSKGEEPRETMVTIEPIFDFDLDDLVELVVLANPKWVNIGADSKGHKLPEPSKDKVKKLIQALQEKTQIKLKRNIERIYNS